MPKRDWKDEFQEVEQKAHELVAVLEVLTTEMQRYQSMNDTVSEGAAALTAVAQSLSGVGPQLESAVKAVGDLGAPELRVEVTGMQSQLASVTASIAEFLDALTSKTETLEHKATELTATAADQNKMLLGLDDGVNQVRGEVEALTNKTGSLEHKFTATAAYQKKRLLALDDGVNQVRDEVVALTNKTKSLERKVTATAADQRKLLTWLLTVSGLILLMVGAVLSNVASPALARLWSFF
jgi:chromosome segregation ATPase